MSAALSACALMAATAPAQAQQPYALFRIGLYDAAYTGFDGTQSSSVGLMSEGYAAGSSVKYSGGVARGEAAWVANVATGTTTRVGLYDENYTESTGYQSSRVDLMSGGYAAGISNKYSGGYSFGQAAWVANAATGATVRVGFHDAAYTGFDGTQFSRVDLISGGYVAGISKKYTGEIYWEDSLGEAAWVANTATGTTSRIGLYDAAYTRSDGYQSSRVDLMSGGYTAGSSVKYSGGFSRGRAAWVANAATGSTTRVGLYDEDYTHPNGFQSSIVEQLSGGYAVGYSEKYSGENSLGRAEWVANAATGTTTRIGLYDAAYTSFDGTQSSRVEHFSGGYAAGYSVKYNGENSLGGENLGRAAWVANAATGTTVRVGFYDAAYTSFDGTQSSRVDLMSGGYAAGYSVKYSGGFSGGAAAWVANAATGSTTRVGLYDEDYTHSNGFQSSIVDLMSGGYAAGYSVKYSGENSLGRAAWVANAANGTTVRVGLYDAAYTASDGYQYSRVEKVSGGYAAGSSAKYSGENFLGQAAWVANTATGTTTRIGLYDAVFTRSDGYQSSGVGQLSGGYAVGYSEKYSGENSLGRAEWVANAANGTTVRVGLYDAAYTASDGYQYSIAEKVSGGYAAGSSRKYSGEDWLGQTAWIFNLQTQEIDAISLSVNPATGDEYSAIYWIYDTGLAIGKYTLFDETGLILGLRVFAWTSEDGAFDLASAVPGGLSASGWASLNEAFAADPEIGAIIGSGSLPNGSSGLFLALSVPEPGSAGLLAFGALALCARRRRQS